MRLPIYLYLFLASSFSSCAQHSIPEVLEKFNHNTVDYISADSLRKMEPPVLLDARERGEFEVSHLKNSVWVGYETFEIDRVLETFPDKDVPIVVYCSLGVRSEDIGEKLKKAGFTNVKNLYGGIFEWKNKGYPVYDLNQKETEKVHAYSTYWGNFLINAEKVYTHKTGDTPE
ncbi:MAG: rhodanese-like domain-containing protein [Allomuricauda sp.]